MEVESTHTFSNIPKFQGDEDELVDRNGRSQNILIPVHLDGSNNSFGYYYLDNYQFPNDGQKNLDEIIGTPLKVELAGLNIYVGPIIPKFQDNYVNALFTLADSIDRCDSSGHSQETGIWAQRLAQFMRLPGIEVLTLGLAGKLHDIGKSVVSKDLLTKPGPLSQTEWSIMKQHPVYSAALMDPIHALDAIKPMVRWHHERYDGTGYPDGICNKNIPIGSRILSVVDAYTTMIGGRKYKDPISKESALKELIRCKGTQFDPEIVLMMVELVRNGSHIYGY
jgi:HD-GYP domain-containing protein (c-di-GMP phosphodiesterase class II)